MKQRIKDMVLYVNITVRNVCLGEFLLNLNFIFLLLILLIIIFLLINQSILISKQTKQFKSIEDAIYRLIEVTKDQNNSK